jgi:hypothetical protein
MNSNDELTRVCPATDICHNPPVRFIRRYKTANDGNGHEAMRIIAGRLLKQIERETCSRLADALIVSCGKEVVADILNGLLAIEAEARLSDSQVATAQMVFDMLAERCPQAVSMAQGR